MTQPVILCGGSGTRLWPLSREHHPKPFHALNGERTLLQETAARCQGLAAIAAVTSDDPVLLAMPSDHFISDRAAFQRAVERGAALAQQGHIVTFGVPPSAPETGYGYIRADQAGYVEAFVEKPDSATAREYLASGRYLLNSGIFPVRASVWLPAVANLRQVILRAR